jgi:ATP phosphoribosyltransferase
VTELTIAVAKGRLLAETLDLLTRAGLIFSSEALSSRRLSIQDESGRFRLIFVKPADVPVYVEHGIADCGIVGRDVLLESDADLLQPLSLNIGACRIVVAARNDAPEGQLGMLKVATKYPRIAARHFGARGVAVDLIELAGSVELASVLGLADCIVDLVETGKTIQDNGLRIIEVITDSAAHLVVNRASYQLKGNVVGRFIRSLDDAQQRGASDD